jgi:hypothetical protein
MGTLGDAGTLQGGSQQLRQFRLLVVRDRTCVNAIGTGQREMVDLAEGFVGDMCRLIHERESDLPSYGHINYNAPRNLSAGDREEQHAASGIS